MTKTEKRLWTGLLAICLSAGLTGCALLGRPATKVLDPNTAVVRMLKAAPYTPPCDGYFVPDATMLRVLDQLGEKDVFGNSPAPTK